MIEALARSLAATLPDATAEDIADLLLWLSMRSTPVEGPVSPKSAHPPASLAPPFRLFRESTERPPRPRPDLLLRDQQMTTPGSRAVPATTLGLQAPRSAGKSLATVPVLAAFKRVTRPGPLTVDIDATVEATADAEQLSVKTKAILERGLDVDLVADVSPVMTACQGLVAELDSLLRRSGAFRSVRRWSLVPDSLLLRDGAGAEHDPGNLVDPWGRRLILIVTDAIADHWYSPGLWRLIERWARVMPTTALHVLPAQYRTNNALGSSGLTMRYRRPGGPNSSATTQRSWWDTGGDHAVPLPVVELTPDGLANWARAATLGNTSIAAVWTRPPTSQSPRLANAKVTDEDRVRAFMAVASPGARDLARLLARAPELSWSLIAMLQARLLPATGARELAEVLAGGLLVRTGEAAGDGQPTGFKFRPGAIQPLRRGTTATQIWDTFDEISAYLARHASTGRDIRALLVDPAGQAELDDNLKPFAALGHSMASRLGLTTGTSPIPAIPSPRPTPAPRSPGQPLSDPRRLSDQLERGVTVNAGVVMLGAPVSGKTTFLAALYIALARIRAAEKASFGSAENWSLTGVDRSSTYLLTELTRRLTHREFPETTLGIEQFSWLIRGEFTRATRRLFGTKFVEQEVRVTLHLADPAGESLRPDEPGARSTIWREDLLNELEQNRGIILLFDPVTEFERGGAFSYTFPLLSELAQSISHQPDWDGYLPHYVAVCITKFDESRVFRSAYELDLLNIDDNYFNFPRVEDDDAREFAERLSRVMSSGTTDLFLRALEQYFRPDHIKYFVTSAIGFYLAPGTNSFDPADYQNYSEGSVSEGPSRIRGPVYPINVAEPLLWLAGKLADDTPESAR